MARDDCHHSRLARTLVLLAPLALLACDAGEPIASTSASDSEHVRDARITRGGAGAEGGSIGEPDRAPDELDASVDGGMQRDAALGEGMDASMATRPDGALVPPEAEAPEARDAGGAASDAPRAGSCFGRCGVEALLALPGDCACDVGCLERDDCCADKHALCAASETTALCPLTGADGASAACGSDLGWSFVHDGAQEILFGDSYERNCGLPLLYDDAQGRLPLARPAVVPARPPAGPVACGPLLELDVAPARDTFAPIRLFEDGRALSSWLLETPLTAFSDGTRVFTIARRGSTISPVYIAVRDASASSGLPERTVYRVLTQYATTYFQNLTATAVSHFAPEQPEQTDYRDGTGGLFLFGRAQFHGEDARKLYLAYQRLPFVDESGSTRWAPLYFAGMDGDVPRFSGLEADALPIIDDDFSMTMQHEVAFVPELDRWLMLYGGDVSDGLSDAPNDQPRHGAIHMRMAPHPWGPWTRPAPLLMREHAARFLHCDAPREPPRGASAGCDLDDVPDDPERSYSTGEWGKDVEGFADCRTDMPAPRQPALTPGTGLPCAGSQRGNLYAPNLLLPWTADRAGEQGYAHAATLYFNVSTWYPYQVVLAATSIHLP